MTDWVTEFFRRADALDADGVAELLTDDVALNFGNWDTQSGRDAVRQTFADFYSSIAGMSHSFVNVWEVNGGAIVESKVTYSKSEDEHVEIPAMTFLSQAGDKISGIRIYIDMAPLYT